ncbi:MAG: aspartate/glutamate racemase family protein [Planctomycetota bacterium]|nr:aspartate/glutamate racemase family protein [Planctomycetota bacterium]
MKPILPLLMLLSIPHLATANAVADSPETTQVLDTIIVHATQPTNSDAPFSFDKSDYQGDLTKLPIGVFDSGIGGLTVLEAILSLDAFNNDNLRPEADGRPDFANERFIYLGDQANMPYGNYAARRKEDYLRELILKDTLFLLGKRSFDMPTSTKPRFDKPPVKAIVIACNTATAYGLEDVRQAIQKWGIPVFVVGVVEAGARGVNELISPTDAPSTIAIMATVGTCASNAYPKAIDRVTGLAGKRIPTVIQQGSVALAGAIEGDPAFVKNPHGSNSATIADYIQNDVTSLVENYRQSGPKEPIKMVVLGCTHFPLVEEEILKAFERLRTMDSNNDGKLPYQQLVAEHLQVVDPAKLVAKELFRRLAADRLRLTGTQASILKEDSFYMSVPSPNVAASLKTTNGDLTVEHKYGRETGKLYVEDTRVVPMRVEMLPESSRKLIQNRLPQVWKRLGK